MEHKYLMSAELHKLAPGSSHRPEAKAKGLLDTPAFLAYALSEYDCRPVFALQRPSHGDASKARAKDGRHLVVASNPRSGALFLLNSHTVDRRVRIGIGWYGVQHKTPQFLIARMSYIQRWKDFKPALDKLTAVHEELRIAYNRLQAWCPTAATIKELAGRVVPAVYIERVKPQPSSIAPDIGWAMDQVLFGMMQKMRDGNLTAGRNKRNVKAILGPDALFDAAHAVCSEGFDFAVDKAKLPQRLRATIL